MERPVYLGAFQETKNNFKLFGSKLLVERMEAGELKSKGGLILAAPTHAKSSIKSMEPLICLVLAAGEGYTADDGTNVPLTVKPGNVIITNANGVSFFSTIPGVPTLSQMKVGITTESDAQMVFESIEQFEAYVSVLEKVT